MMLNAVNTSSLDDGRLANWIDPAWMLMRFRECVTLPRGWRIQSVRIVRVFPSKPLGLGAQYEVQLAGPRSVLRGFIYLSPRSAKRVSSCAEVRIRRRAPVRLTGFLLPVMDGRMLLHTPDCDPALPQIGEALNCRYMARHLAARRLIQCEVLSYRPGRRCTVAYRPRHRNSAYWVGKIYGYGNGLQAIDTLENLRGSLNGNRACIPTVVRRIPRLNMVVTEGLGGAVADRPSPRRRARAAGRLLALLHETRPPDSVFRVRDELNVLDRWLRLAGSLEHELPEARQVRQWLEREGQMLPRARPRFLHRDFYDQQLVWAEHGPVLVDLDTASSGDPELDLGNYLAHSMWRAVRRGRSVSAERRLQSLFVAGYRDQAPRARLSVARLRFYYLTSLLRVGTLHSMRSSDGPWARRLLRRTRRWAATSESGGLPGLTGERS